MTNNKIANDNRASAPGLDAAGDANPAVLPLSERIAAIVKLRKVFIYHPNATAILRALDQLKHYGNSGADVGNPSRTLLITGPSGSGKTRLLKHWAAQFQPVVTDDETTKPVLFVDIPEQSSAKGLVEHCLKLLGSVVPVNSRDSITVLTERLIHFIRERKVEIIIFDELQHVEHGTNKKRSIVTADFFKTILNASICPVVLSGIEQAAEIYDSNIQLRRRSNGRLVLPRFDWRNPEERTIFRALLAAFEESLPFSLPSNLGDIRTALRIFYLADGLFGRAVDIIVNATERALDEGITSLSWEILEITSKDLLDGLEFNPFTAQDDDLELKVNALSQRYFHKDRVTRLRKGARLPKASDAMAA